VPPRLTKLADLAGGDPSFSAGRPADRRPLTDEPAVARLWGFNSVLWGFNSASPAGFVSYPWLRFACYVRFKDTFLQVNRPKV